MILLALGEKLLGPLVAKFLPELLLVAAVGAGLLWFHHQAARMAQLQAVHAMDVASAASATATIADLRAQVARNDAAMAGLAAAVRRRGRTAGTIVQRIVASPATANGPDAPVLGAALDALAAASK